MTQHTASSNQDRHRLNIQFKVETADHQRVTLFVESLSEQPELYRVLESMHDKGTPLPNPLSPNAAARLIMFALLRHRLFLRTEHQQEELDSLPELHSRLSAATVQVSELQNVRQELIEEKARNAELLKNQEHLQASLEQSREENAVLEELTHTSEAMNADMRVNSNKAPQFEAIHTQLLDTQELIHDLTEALRESDYGCNTRDVLWLVKCNFRDFTNSIEQVAGSLGCELAPCDLDTSEGSQDIHNCLQELLSLQQSTNTTTNEIHEAFTSVMQKLAEPLLERARHSDYEKLRSYQETVTKAVDDVIARNISLHNLLDILKKLR